MSVMIISVKTYHHHANVTAYTRETSRNIDNDKIEPLVFTLLSVITQGADIIG